MLQAAGCGLLYSIPNQEKRHMKRAAKTGFSLVEVLISLFIIAVGVVGALGMHMTALRTTQQSIFQSSAVHLAAEMSDKMRANVRSMQAADGNNPYLNVDYQSIGNSSESKSAANNLNCYDSSTACNSHQLAEFDIAEWLGRLERALPGVRVRICRDAEPWNAVAQNFSWHCSSTENRGAIVVKIGWVDKDNKDESQAGFQFAPSIALTVAPYAQ